MDYHVDIKTAKQVFYDKSQDTDHLGYSNFGILTVFIVELLSDLTVKYILSI